MGIVVQQQEMFFARIQTWPQSRKPGTAFCGPKAALTANGPPQTKGLPMVSFALQN